MRMTSSSGITSNQVRDNISIGLTGANDLLSQALIQNPEINDFGLNSDVINAQWFDEIKTNQTRSEMAILVPTKEMFESTPNKEENSLPDRSLITNELVTDEERVKMLKRAIKTKKQLETRNKNRLIKRMKP